MLAALALASSIAQCLQALGNSPERSRWTSFEDRRRWHDAATGGAPLVSKGVQCVTGVAWTSESSSEMIVPLQWGVLVGVDAFRAGDANALRSIGNQYLPLALRYESGDDDEFDRQAYRRAILYLKDFRAGKCSYDLCVQKDYP